MEKIQWIGSLEVSRFIHENLESDINKLLLNPPAEFKENINEIADQIISRRKAKTKLPDWYANQQLVMPPPLSLEQSSSIPTANYKQTLLKGTSLIDLTGGMGIDTIALAENFERTTYVEQDPWLCEIFAHNAKVLSRQHIQVECTSAEQFLESFKGKATFYIDPARRDRQQKKVFHFENCTPDVTSLLPLFIRKAHQVLIKAAPLIDLTLGIQQLQYVHDVHVVSVKNEVKEVLFLLDFQKKPTVPQIHCINLQSDQPPFEFRFSEEKKAEAHFGPPASYLYDPNSAILKGGAFKLAAVRFGLKKLAPNTHLYTSENFIPGFPGRIFEVVNSNCSKQDVSKIIPGGQANVITKNHPMKPEELKKVLKLKDGGNWYVIGYRDQQDRPLLMVGKLPSLIA